MSKHTDADASDDADAAAGICRVGVVSSFSIVSRETPVQFWYAALRGISSAGRAQALHA